jgi:hypothetical protein
MECSAYTASQRHQWWGCLRVAEGLGGTSINRRRRALVAIGHSYLQQYHCLVGTRIHLHLLLIAKAFPHLLESLELPEQVAGVPFLMSLSWYPREEWNQLLEDFVDADQYPSRWNEWRQRAETGLETLGSRGTLRIPIELSRSEILAYCHDKRLPNNSQTRVALANEKLMRQVRA